MHPWMLEQVASEHRRDLLARAQTARTGTGGTRTAGLTTQARWPWRRGDHSPTANPSPFRTAVVRSWPRLRILR